MENRNEEYEVIPLSPDDVFPFSCSRTVSCFNECCRDITQFLTPYDILRLKSHLGIHSNEFLKQYTTQHTGPETGLPVIVLRQDHSSDMKCPFVRPEGCSVYENRPSSCRIYPLARLASRSRETGKIAEHYVLLQEDHCKGHFENHQQTVGDWVKQQGLEIYNEMNDLMMEIISLKKQVHPAALDFREKHMFHMALYDLDNFRTQVFGNRALDKLEISSADLAAAEKEDPALLKLGIRWVKYAIFGMK
ncbi:MAG: YkgJ family cysteine cluster protein [Desulfobacterales bacterium]